jgi:TfoX/Sxy family transcriptional regulator of competence genes
MKWHKSPDALVQAFDHCLPSVAGVRRKAMFGYPCAFVNGHLFCGLHQDSLIVRLPDARRNALVAKGASVFEPIPGRAMREYVVAPADIVADRENLRALLNEALAHASSLAPKPKKPRAAKKKATAPKRKAARPARNAAPAKKAAPAKRVTPRASPKKKRSR